MERYKIIESIRNAPSNAEAIKWIHIYADTFLKPQWIRVEDNLSDHLETVILANDKGFVCFGCRVVLEDGWHWAASNGVIYSKNGKIVSECESDDLDVTRWHKLPNL